MVRYKELRRTLADEIATGVHPVGAKFPTEYALCDRFGVSRHTVREALRALEEGGLLSRTAGAGTVVLKRAPEAHYAQTVGSLDELADYAAETSFEKKHEGIVHARQGLADLLGTEAGTRWLRFAGLRRAADRPLPVCWTEIFVAEPYFDVRDTPDDGPLYDRIRRKYGLDIAEVEQRVEAMAMPTDIAPLLEAAPGAPALMTRRRYFAGSETPFEISLSLHPGDRYAFTQRLRRANGHNGEH